MKLQLAEDTYWRIESSDILITNENAILRLRSKSAKIFLTLIGCNGDTMENSEEIVKLSNLLENEGLLIRAGGVLDPWSHNISHMVVK